MPSKPGQKQASGSRLGGLTDGVKGFFQRIGAALRRQPKDASGKTSGAKTKADTATRRPTTASQSTRRRTARRSKRRRK
jgi:hypothetical protein